jgi:hypothetical protein
MEPPCEWCMKAEQECQQKVQGPRCECCAQWKVGCSAVSLKRKGGERKAEQKVIMEDVEEESVVSLELSDGVMEQVEIMAKELGNINRGIWALVVGVRKLTEVMEWMERKDESRADRVDKEVEIEGVQRVSRGIETEIMLEEESEDGEDEVEKSKGEKEGTEKDREDKEEKADRDREN